MEEQILLELAQVEEELTQILLQMESSKKNALHTTRKKH
jgi:hypothetical protein